MNHSNDLCIEPRITIRRLAKLLGVTPHTIRNWVKRGQFPAPERIGATRLWRMSLVVDRLARAATKAAS